jgi:DNA transformation protein
MKPIPEIVRHCVDLLRGVGPVATRRMFGSWGIFVQGRMFALVSDETLYLKVDAHNRAAFEAEGLAPFAYEGKTGRVVELPYRQAPPDAMEDPAGMRPWAQGAVDTALRTSPARRADTVAGQLNLGPKSAQWLADVGIRSPADLKRLGAAAVYARVKHARPRSASLNLLHALHGAVTGQRWDRLDEATKAKLLRDAQKALNALERNRNGRVSARKPKR